MQEWKGLFSQAIIRHLTIVHSDYMELLLDLVLGPEQPRRSKKKLFRFDHTWVREKGCEGVIEAAWQADCVGTPMFRLVHKIKQCRLHLIQWSQSQVRVMRTSIDTL